MKRRSILLMFMTLSILFACNSNDSIDNNGLNFTLRESITLNKGKNSISGLLFNAGVTDIDLIEDKENYTRIAINTSKGFVLNGENLDLSKYNVEIDSYFMSLIGYNDYKISLVEGLPYLKTKTFSGYLKDYKGNLNKEISILLLYLNDFTTNNEVKFTTSDVLERKNIRGGCSFWDTYYVYGVGLNSHAAQSNLKSELTHYYENGTIGYGNNGCEAIGEITNSCAFGEHGCVSTLAFCCP